VLPRAAAAAGHEDRSRRHHRAARDGGGADCPARAGAARCGCWWWRAEDALHARHRQPGAGASSGHGAGGGRRQHGARMAGGESAVRRRRQDCGAHAAARAAGGPSSRAAAAQGAAGLSGRRGDARRRCGWAAGALSAAWKLAVGRVLVPAATEHGGADPGLVHPAGGMRGQRGRAGAGDRQPRADTRWHGHCRSVRVHLGGRAEECEHADGGDAERGGGGAAVATRGAGGSAAPAQSAEHQTRGEGGKVDRSREARAVRARSTIKCLPQVRV